MELSSASVEQGTWRSISDKRAERWVCRPAMLCAVWRAGGRGALGASTTRHRAQPSPPLSHLWVPLHRACHVVPGWCPVLVTEGAGDERGHPAPGY